jgi:hypothetical protein
VPSACLMCAWSSARALPTYSPRAPCARAPPRAPRAGSTARAPPRDTARLPPRANRGEGTSADEGCVFKCPFLFTPCDLRARGDICLHRHLPIYRPSQVGVCETALQGARLRLARAHLAAGGDARGARGATRDPSEVPPSTQGMLTISRPPPRRCSAACLLGSAARRLCIFFACRWQLVPCDHGPCCTLRVSTHGICITTTQVLTTDTLAPCFVCPQAFVRVIIPLRTSRTDRQSLCLSVCTVCQ